MTIRVLCCLTMFAAAIVPVLSQETKGSEKTRDAFVKIMNVCDTSQKERWRTGLDLKFKNRTIGSDIRLGEHGPTGKISFTGRDCIEVFRHGTNSQPLARVPANLKSGGFYTLVVLGQLDSDSVKLDVRVIEEYPIPEAGNRKGQCRVQLVNAIEKFPIAIGINTEDPTPISFGETHELFFPPGEVDLGLFFKDSRGELRRLQAGLIAEPDGNYTAVVYPSAERSDRPGFMRTNAASERAAALIHVDTP